VEAPPTLHAPRQQQLLLQHDEEHVATPSQWRESALVAAATPLEPSAPCDALLAALGAQAAAAETARQQQKHRKRNAGSHAEPQCAPQQPQQPQAHFPTSVGERVLQQDFPQTYAVVRRFALMRRSVPALL
jgi:hypothetical protein